MQGEAAANLQSLAIVQDQVQDTGNYSSSIVYKNQMQWVLESETRALFLSEEGDLPATPELNPGSRPSDFPEQSRSRRRPALCANEGHSHLESSGFRREGGTFRRLWVLKAV